MVSKIKVKVKAENANINLPSIPMSWLPFFLKMAIRVQTKNKHNDETNDEMETEVAGKQSSVRITTGVDVSDVMEQLEQFLKEAKPLFKTLDPFTLVEVQSEDAYVLIEMR